MGYNFYTLDNKYIGKRSVAGWYCFNCNISLCIDGEHKVHYYESEWYNRCPICGKIPKKESLDNSNIEIELGFNRNISENEKGVRNCLSFSWAKDPLMINKLKFVKDEYGKRLSIKKFIAMLKKCPIQLRSYYAQDNRC